MKFQVITVFPEMITSYMQLGVVGQGLKKELFSIDVINPRTFTTDFHKTVDDRPFGGGDGMVMLAEPLSKAIDHCKSQGSEKVIYLSPQGKVWNDSLAREYSAKFNSITFVCGRYGGIDQRLFKNHIDEEVSIGDYVLSGGELGALVLMDSLLRFRPGVLGHVDSKDSDSFSHGLLEEPQYTRPQIWNDLKTPDALLSGHHLNILEWKKVLSEIATLIKRPDLFAAYWGSLSATEKKQRKIKIHEHISLNSSDALTAFDATEEQIIFKFNQIT